MKVDKSERTPYIMKTSQHFNDVRKKSVSVSLPTPVSVQGFQLLQSDENSLRIHLPMFDFYIFIMVNKDFEM